MTTRRLVIQECWDSESERVQEDIRNEWERKKAEFYATNAKEKAEQALTEEPAEISEVGELIE
jgi:hypothetical protein